MGPSPAREGRPIGSASPTTASRMDNYTPRFLDMGLRGMVGKGKRTKEVLDAVIRNHAVYFAAIGGEGALLSKKILSSEVIVQLRNIELIKIKKESKEIKFETMIDKYLFLR